MRLRMKQLLQSRQGPLLLLDRSVFFGGQRQVVYQGRSVCLRHKPVLAPESIQRIDPLMGTISTMVNKLGNYEVPESNIVDIAGEASHASAFSYIRVVASERKSTQV
jgi:hypothetical protein